MIAAGRLYGTISDVPTLRIAQDDAADELLGRDPARVPQLCIAQYPVADELLSRDPLALVVGMLLDRHMRQRSSRASWSA